jgi:hypothetical protein
MQIKSTIKILPLFLLLVLAFNFFHSEVIDQYEANSDCQEQDFCRLVQTTIVKPVSNNLYNINYDKSICFHCVIEIDQNNNAYQDFNYVQFNPGLKPARVYLNNKVLLI